MVTPEKPFVLPSYAEKSARRLVEKSPLLLWGKKGKRSLRAATMFVDDIAEETDREESSSVSDDSDGSDSAEASSG